jgi:hypothetical protein
MSFDTIADIRAANARAGHHFFEPATMRFFRSRIESTVYGGRYFVTSEQFAMGAHKDPRRFTVRMANDDGTIDTVGEFQAYSTLEVARATARELACVAQ